MVPTSQCCVLDESIVGAPQRWRYIGVVCSLSADRQGWALAENAMPVDSQKLTRILERLRDAGHRTLAPSAKDLFQYVEGFSPQSSLYQSLEADRLGKWAKWGPAGLCRWEMPDEHHERLSLSWDLYKSVAEQSQGGNGLLHTMYAQNFETNVASFNGDFFGYLVELIEALVNAEPSLKPKVDGERDKHQKFGILDAPQLLQIDMASPAGVLGRAVIFLDLDAFKLLNEKFTERAVDRAFLPAVQRLIASVVEANGFAYAEGGDEMIVFLPNSSKAMSIALASELRALIAGLRIEIDGTPTSITASLGLAWEHSGSGSDLADQANLAKRHSKHSGKNCVCLYGAEHMVVVDPLPPT